MADYFTLDNFNFHGKIVGVRVDINSPIIKGKVVYNDRIKNASKMIKELVRKGAKVVVLAHQGRRGRQDYVSLKSHQLLLEQNLKQKIKFSKEIYSESLKSSIEKLKNGDVILLENLRFFDDEFNFDLKDNKLLELEKLFDYYVLDAFSVSHRNQVSVCAIKTKPVIAGRNMERELQSLEKLDSVKRPHIFVFGGEKTDDLIPLIRKALENELIDKIILTGILGEFALKAKGFYLGLKEEYLESQDYIKCFKEFEELYLKYETKFEIPVDVVLFDGKNRIEIPIEKIFEDGNVDLVSKFAIGDIGMLSVDKFESTIKKAGSIYFKGPAGNFEEKNFEKGTKELLKKIVNSRGFKFIGGGHSITAARMFNLIKKFSYVSLAGGTLVHYLSGKELPGVKALKESFETGVHNYYDFVVVGSNTIDIKIDVPEKLSNIEIGEKMKIKENIKISNGGGGINTSIVFSRLNTSVGYLGKISGEFKEVLLKTLRNNNISLIDSKETRRSIAKSVLLQTKDHDRVIFTFRGQNDFLDMNDFNLNSFNSNNYYFTALNKKSLLTQIRLARIIKRSNKNALICYNPSLYLIKEEGKNLVKLIKLVDFVIFNFEEAKELTGESEIGLCLRKVYEMGPKVVVITNGANGSYAFDGRREYYQKAKIPKRIIDTTGAGDCFAATFFYFYGKRYNISIALQYASINASALITKSGTQNGILTFKELVKVKKI